MSHNSKENTGYITNFQPFVVCFVLLCFVFLSLFSANISHAAVNPGTKTERNPVRVLKSTLSELADRDQAILNWQNQELEIVFDLPADGWYESLDLFLTAIPEGNVARTDPITISYNGEKPIPLYGQASRFDAHIKLDPARIRTARNSLKIKYRTPHKQDCLTPEHGKWIIDLNRSKLATKTRSKPRNLQISEFKQRLNHPMTAPKRVAIRAFGENKISLEALVAQGIASRMDNLPSFQFTTANADLEILVGEHDEIKSFVGDKKLLETRMTRAFTDSGSRPKLVLTGQSSDDVLALARGFARHEMPNARRRHISLNEFYASPQFNPSAIVTAGTHKLAEIGDTTITPSWNPTPAELSFNVTNPDSSEGKLTLNIVKSPVIDAKSRLRVRLNNRSIGYTMLDKKQKFVSFDIKPGMFRSAGNKITIEPDLVSQTAGFSCASHSNIPSLLVSNRSKLQIKSIDRSVEANLNQFAASGAPLFNGTENMSAIVLTARSASDRAASLQFLGYAAQQFGPRFANAEYLSEFPAATDRNKNILILGPNAIDDEMLLEAAPSALRLALRGKPTTGPNTLTVASIERYAGTADALAVRRLAQQYSKDARIQTGGIASLFASPFSDKHMIGVITSNRPSQFAKSMRSLTKPGYWNGLQGSVARWDSNTIMMAQTGNVLPASYGPQKTKLAWNEIIVQKWDGSVEKVKALFNRQTQPKQPKQAAPVTGPKVQTTAVSTAPIKLRGASLPQIRTRQATTQTPLIVQAKTLIKTKYAAVQKSVISFRDNDTRMVAAREWVKDQANNRNTLMALIIISISLMIGMATPKVR